MVEVTPDRVVKVKLTGACGGCLMSQVTLKMGIERAPEQEVPELKEVVAVQRGRSSRETILIKPKKGDIIWQK